ncbi:Uncharacterised protein [Mycobacteroides abscessus]|uniref:hypothetical protein n=1 Tax=Mycobacteroides abscessus TaxID=36809 RepID=UPI0005DE1744|nr:hypothetical protein [Mycobacteroides abscessus]CPR38245.1 Uncharacterised protein [Mycobacteroides abscessus]CPR75199.1 Uncharacterised protein [Mycobacteroides abscessus]CPS03337.1 Uncharacterised protein [Mycobacteroides abscessus]CPS08574.1 Uncharacterised protein [Mycobacteroides abscessus]CPS53547.1 Uncharacterised protein [Mycobacteroides abscessus]
MASRLRKTKAALLAVALTLAGILLIMANGWVSAIELGDWGWLHALPLGELGGTLFGAGLLGTLFEYSFRKDQEEATVEQFRDIIKEQAPAMRDAVIAGFAIHPEDLKRVANPELLDDIASNVMSLRLGDEQFAREIYRDIRDQAIHAAERWYDVEVRIRLSSALERSAPSTPLFDVVVEWEYTTVPSGPVRRFACVSDRDEYNELVLDAATAAWFIVPRRGVDPSSRDAYELLELTVDGERKQITRAARKTGQTYTVHLDATALAGEPVRIRQVFRTVTPTWGHRLFFELPQPGRNISLTLDYTNTDIARMRVSDTVGALVPPRVSELPNTVPGRVISVESTGWLLAKAGFAFTWTLESELPHDEGREAA